MQREVAENQQPWKINVRARARKFDFKFRASNIEPTWNFLKFSMFLRVYQFFLEVKSELDTPIPKDKKSRILKSKFGRFFRKFKPSPSKKRSIPSKKPSNPQYSESKSLAEYTESKSLAEPQKKVDLLEPMCGGSLMIGTAASLSHSVLEKDQIGIVIYGSSVLLFLILLQNKFLSGKETRFSLVYLAIATMVFEGVGFCLVKYMDYDEVWLSEIVWKAWNYCVSSGCLYVLSRVTLSRFCHSVGVGLGTT